jgi:thiol-disulfide isomerase/thioredoxin
MAGETIWQVLVLLLFVSAVAQGVVLVAVMRQVGGVIVQIRPPQPGQLEEGPAAGTVLDLPEAGPARPRVVVFVTPHCRPCEDLMPAVPVAARQYREIEFVAVVTGSDEADRRTYARTIEGVTARSDLHFLQDEWHIPATPYAVGLDGEGRVIQAGVVNHLDHLESLADAVVHGYAPAPHDGSPPSANGDAGANGHGAIDAVPTPSASNRMEVVDG